MAAMIESNSMDVETITEGQARGVRFQETPEIVVATASDESESHLTSECPPPPFYYKLFKTATEGVDGLPISPPRLCDVPLAAVQDEALAGLMDDDALHRLALQKQLYGGTVQALRRNRIYSPITDYKALLKQHVQKLLTVSLELTSNVPPTHSSEVSILALNATLTEIHNVLGEYRMHEGRETLIALRKAEIIELRKLADEMQALLQEQGQIVVKQE